MITVLATALVLCMAAAQWPALSLADDSPTKRTQAAKAVCSTAQQGSKLQWLPFRPSKPRADSRVVQAGHVTESTSVARRSEDNPFSDPFGDRRLKPRGATRPPTRHDNGLGPAKPGPLFADSNLQFPEEEPAAEPGLRDLPEPAPGRMEFDTPPSGPLGGPGQFSPLQEDYMSGQVALERPCPSADDKDFHTPIGELTSDTTAKDEEGQRVSRSDLPRECPLDDDVLDPDALRPWCETTFAWKASGLCHKPLYFEDVHLERYGHSHGPYIQPIISGAHFFLSVPALPYMMGLCPPKECEYTLGYYRPGNCAPYLLDPLPLSLRAALVAGGAWTGAAFALP